MVLESLPDGDFSGFFGRVSVYKNVVCDLRIYHFLNIQGGMLIYKIQLEGLRDDFPLPWVARMISRRSMISMIHIYIYEYVDYIYICIL